MAREITVLKPKGCETLLKKVRERGGGRTGAIGYGKPDQPVIVTRGRVKGQEYTIRRGTKVIVTSGEVDLLMIEGDPDLVTLSPIKFDSDGNRVISVRDAHDLGLYPRIPRRERFEKITP